MNVNTFLKTAILASLLYLPTLNVQATTQDNQLYSFAEIYTEALLDATQPYAYYIDLPLERHNKFIDNTPEGQVKLEKMEDELLSELLSLDSQNLPNEKAKIFYAKLLEALESSIDKRICKSELWNVNHMDSPHAVLGALIYIQPLESEQNKQDALERWLDAAKYYPQEVSNLRNGLKLGYSAPKRVVERVIKQLKQLTLIDINDHPYMQLAKRANDKDFEQSFAKLLKNELLPAMIKYSDYLKSEYLPKARVELGISVLPNGRDCYIAQYRSNTTLKKTPEQVYELGLKTVNQNKQRVRELGKAIYGTSSFEDAVTKANLDASQKFSNDAELHAFYVAVVERSKIKTKEAFGRMPIIELEVEAIPDYQQGTGISAHYVQGNNERTAKFAYDPTNFANENFGTAEIVSVHEGYPGHHQQIALMQEQKNFHPIEAAFANSAYAEGWARYSEALAEELNIYQSKSAKILRRSWPARGMVADTALHVLGWSNEKVAAYIKESGNPAVSNDTDAMLDRMAVLPAQLTSYDSGGLEIFALRAEYKKIHGKKYDIKEFHQLILKNGNVPLSLLREQVLKQSND